jgi:maltooligosyltrehalose synthase
MEYKLGIGVGWLKAPLMLHYQQLKAVVVAVGVEETAKYHLAQAVAAGGAEAR